jgi:hypothetical protein
MDIMNTTTYRWESMEHFQFSDGIRIVWVTWEKSYRGGHGIGGDAKCVSVRGVDTFGPRADFKVVS